MPISYVSHIAPRNPLLPLVVVGFRPVYVWDVARTMASAQPHFDCIRPLTLIAFPGTTLDTIETVMKRTGEKVVRIEASALAALADRIAGPMAAEFENALNLLYQCSGRVVVTGMGKSGIIAHKIAATLSSTGTPSLYMHPAEALHGDLGMLVGGDVVLALSSSGETEEIVALLPTMKRLAVKLITMTGDCPPRQDKNETREGAGRLLGKQAKKRAQASSKGKTNAKLSTLASAADVVLDCSVAREACSLGLAPTASTTTMLALGDALAVALAEKRGFREEDFANLHPGGKLGKKLAKVKQLMHTGDALPRVTPETPMAEVIYEMSRKKLGVTTVVKDGNLLGIISDGDLRRLLENYSRDLAGAPSSKSGKQADKNHGYANTKEVLTLTARDCMTLNPKTIHSNEFAVTALNVMEKNKITCLAVIDNNGRLEGVLHLHDLWGMESI